ncbi:hypothetical protein KM043_009838 [Ampulex compressa]|nr:hypothetical protein KM043_009838 [Ampulex compressa]
MEMHKSAQYERYCKQMISVGDEATSAEKSYSYNVSTYLLDENKEKDVAPPSYPCATSEKDEETRNVVRQCIRPVQYYVQGCAKVRIRVTSWTNASFLDVRLLGPR